MLLSSEQIDAFCLRGFVKGPRFLDDREVEALRAELQDVLEEKTAKAPALKRNMLKGRTPYGEGNAKEQQVIQIVNIWQASDAFLDLARRPELTATVARLCNNAETLRIWHDQIQFKPPRIGGPANWHQDYPAWPILVPADLVSAWIALDDAEIDNGCMWMVPGSHRWGACKVRSGPNFQPEYDESILPEGVQVKPEPMVVKKGEVAFHHCMNWHGSPSNKTDRPRRAHAIHYMPGYTIYSPQGGHVMEAQVTVKPGEPLAGDSFPVVYERSKVATAAVA